MAIASVCVRFGRIMADVKNVEAKKQKSRYGLIPSYRGHLKFHKLRLSTTQNMEDPECHKKNRRWQLRAFVCARCVFGESWQKWKMSKPKSRNLDMFWFLRTEGTWNSTSSDLVLHRTRKILSANQKTEDDHCECLCARDALLEDHGRIDNFRIPKKEIPIWFDSFLQRTLEIW